MATRISDLQLEWVEVLEATALPLGLDPSLDDVDVLAYGRRLALAVFMDALRDTLRGDLVSWLWLQTEGRAYLDHAGLEHLADLSVDEILAKVNVTVLFEALEPSIPQRSRRCWNCGNLTPTEDGRYACAAGRFGDQTMAHVTVYYTRPRDNCERFVRRSS